jgi:hypothetical protein
MASCANITLEKVRAIIRFGSLSFETPFVKSFNVNRSRSSLAATFSASIEMPSELPAFPVNQEIIIEAGTQGNERQIFIGRVESITVNPSFERADSYVVNLSGRDRLGDLEGRNISRRQRTRGQSTFAAITGVTRKAPERGLSTELRQQSGGGHRIMNDNFNIREHSKLVRTDRTAWDPFGTAKEPFQKDNAEESGAQDVIDITPKGVALSPGVSALYQIENTTYESGDTWTVSDPQIGTIQDQGNGTAIYTQTGLGENKITFSKGDGSAAFIGTATAVGIPIHDHSSLGAGGPAFGVYGSE